MGFFQDSLSSIHGVWIHAQLVKIDSSFITWDVHYGQQKTSAAKNCINPIKPLSAFSVFFFFNGEEK